MNEHSYIIGIDFGTTFSGAGYMYIPNGPEGEIFDIKTWPKIPSYSSFTKVPTIIRYHKTDRTQFKWGQAASDVRDTRDYDTDIKLFKLLLQDDTNILDDTTELPSDLTIVQVVADYLKGLHDHVYSEMAKTLDIQKHEIRYCLTVPAIWKLPAKTKMREAAIRAGLIDREDHADRLVLIGEPEAAAVYVEHMRGGIEFRDRETILICDAGGGTVDLSVFEKVIDGKTRYLEEVTVGDGAPKGSSFLDKEFRELLNRKVKESDLNAVDIDFDVTVKDFITEKERIGYEDSDEIIFFRLPNRFDVNIAIDDFTFFEEDHKVGIRAGLIETQVFDPVVDIILDQIKSQIAFVERQNKKLDYIILVGGFGRSQYLMKKVKKEFSGLVKEVVVPHNAELAVTRGAVYFGYDPYTISHRTMRYTYGIRSTLPCQVNDRKDYVKVNRDGNKVCMNRFQVFVRKGDRVSISEYVEKEYFTTNPHSCPLEIYATSTISPYYIIDVGVKKIATFVLELPEVEAEQSRIDFKIRIYFGHTELKAIVVFPGVQDKVFTATIE